MLKRKLQIGLAALAISLSANVCSASHLIDETSALKGEIVSLVKVGQTVMEGDELARVKTLTGSAPAARATVCGTIAVVYVTVGENVDANSMIAQIAVE